MKLKAIQPAFRKNIITYAVVIAAFILMQLLVMTGSLSSQMTGLLVPVCTYIIMAVSLNLTVGILGELSLGHAGFMCIGAFTSSFFSVCTADTLTSAWIRFPLALLIGALAAAVFGLLIGIPVLRLRGDYLAIVTLAFGEIIKNLVNVIYVGRDGEGFHFAITSASNLQMEPDGQIIINGPMGITGTPNDSSFIIGFVLVILTLVIVLNIVGSRTGRAVMSIRDNRIAAESVGINITKYKLLAFTVSAALAGIAGVLYSHNLNNLSASSNTFGYNISINILVFVVLGGLGSIRGSLIGAVILTVLPEWLRTVMPGWLGDINAWRMIIYSLLLIILMIFSSNPTMIALREKYSPKKWLRARREKKGAE